MSGTYSKTIFDIQTSSETFFEKCEKSGFLALKNAHILQDKVEISTWTGFLIQIILEICLEMLYFLSPSIPCNKRPSFETYDIFFYWIGKIAVFCKTPLWPEWVQIPLFTTWFHFVLLLIKKMRISALCEYMVCWVDLDVLKT